MISKIKTNSHEEWLELRSKYIGGSDCASVVGMNPYMSAYTLWATKTGKIPAFEGNLATKVGTYLEEFVAKLFEEETGKKVHRENQSFVNDEYPWAIGNIDRAIVGENAGLEIKTCSALATKRFKNGEYPENFYCQCMHYLALTGKEKWYLAVLIGNSDFRIFTIERDQAEIDALMQAEKNFWELVKTNTPPAVDGHESTSETLKTLYPQSNEYSVDLMGVADVLADYADLKAQIDNLNERLDEKANLIKDYMKDAEKGEYNRFKVSYKTQAGRTSFDYKTLMKDHSSMDFSKYISTSKPSRPFKVTIKEEK